MDLTKRYSQHTKVGIALRLRLKNDMLMAIDGRKAMILVILDLSAAFDTIDDEIMCSRLERLIQLNSNKTELLVLASSYFRKHSGDVQLQIDNNWISPSDYAKNRGILFD